MVKMSLLSPTNLPHTVSVNRPTEADDGMGSTTKTQAVNIASLKCRIRPTTADEDVYYSRVDVELSHIIYCAVVDIREKDEIVGTSPSNIASRTFEVVGVRNIDELAAHINIAHLEIECVERFRKYS